MNLLKFSLFLGAIALVSVVPAKADLIIPVTVASTSANCLASTGNGTVVGTLDLFAAGGGQLDFGNHATFGTTEPCGAIMLGSTVAYSGLTPIAGPSTFNGSICELQGLSDGCNGNTPPGANNDVIQLSYNAVKGQVTISDLNHGGSFNLVLQVVPEPGTLTLLMSGLLIGGFGLVRRTKSSNSL